MSLSTLEQVLFLREVELFGEVPSEELAAVARIVREVNWRAGDRFIRQGDAADCLYILVEGQVSVVIEGVGQVAQRGPGSVIGEMALISHEPRSAHCIALTDILALQVSQDDFWNLMEEEPRLAAGTIKVLSRRLDESIENLRKLGKGAPV